MSKYVLLTLRRTTVQREHDQALLQHRKAIARINRRFRFHDQRHTFASTLASNGVNSFTLRDLLGHTSMRTTERYARPSAETLEAVRRALA